MTTPADLPASDPDADRPHKPADDREEVYFEGSPAFRWELSRGWYWLIIGLLLIVGPIVSKVLWSEHTPWWLIPLGLILGLCIFLIPWLIPKLFDTKLQTIGSILRGVLLVRNSTRWNFGTWRTSN